MIFRISYLTAAIVFAACAPRDAREFPEGLVSIRTHVESAQPQRIKLRRGAVIRGSGLHCRVRDATITARLIATARLANRMEVLLVSIGADELECAERIEAVQVDGWVLMTDEVLSEGPAGEWEGADAPLTAAKD